MMEKLTKVQEKQVYRLLAQEFVERLGYEPTKQRINNFVKNIVNFEQSEKQLVVNNNHMSTL